MRRTLGALLLSLVGVLGLALPAAAAEPAPTSASAATAVGSAAAVAAAPTGVDDFTFASFDARYDLGRDATGASTLTTTETWVADFPDFDQNRGMRRAIPIVYQGHPTDLEIVSVTDENGTPRSYETDEDDETLVVTIAADDYVHGLQTYVITYAQRDVTGYFADTDDDEFYWDTSGTQVRQPILEHTTTTTVSPDLVGALTGDTACFIGPEGSTQTCSIEQSTGADGSAVFTTSNRDLNAADNVTIGIAFEPHTFTERPTGYFAAGLPAWLQLVAVALALLAAVLSILQRVLWLRDAPGRPTIIPEYTPPKGVDMLLASVIMRKSSRGAAASFVDLAVRRNVQIVERDEAGFLGTREEYWLRLLTWQGLSPAEIELARALFGYDLRGDAWRELKKNDTALAKSIQALMTATRKRAASEGYQRTRVRALSILLVVGAIVLAAVSFVTGVMVSDGGYGGPWPIILLFVSGGAGIIVLATAFRTQLTAKGAELRDYIRGIQMYIDWAEEDRFRVLQSPEGAERTGVNAPDWGQVVKIYEKLLPYAVLLGQETEWAKVLGTYYENLDTSPDWYGSNTAFNAALFATSVSAMSTSIASSYSGSSSSSSSGFSGGGGSSGGGGGGGGAGGV